MASELPHLSERLPAVLDRLRAGQLVLLLDFDGTLAPIVARADDAEMVPESRRAVERLAAAEVAVAVISGRGLRDVRRRVGLASLYYAGNHGLEIEGPDVARLHETAARARGSLDRVKRALDESLAAIPGAWLEDKRLTLSVHYREVPEAVWGEVESRVREAVARSTLEIRPGKRVWEIRPRVDWDKGRAVEFLLETWRRPEAWPLYIGDDETDEDAFAAVGRRGLGVRVATEPPAHTAAGAYLRDPGEVQEILGRLADEAGA